jgi:RNA polymerase sigma-70 factor, ECF subfamily
VRLKGQEQGNSTTEDRLRSERELVEAARADSQAFGKLYDLYFGQIYSYAYYRTRSRPDAEDVCAQTFQQALEHIGSYEWRGVPFVAWLYRIASNIVAGLHRRQLPETELDEAYGVAATDPLPEDETLRSEQAGELRAAVATLPASQQQAVVLKFAQGLRNREIGEIMGCSEGAVKQLLHRAMENLRSRVER